MLRLRADVPNYDSLRHSCRSVFGCSPKQLLLNLRTQQAKNLLLETLGAGAMGSVLGSLLAKSGNDVTLIEVWQETVEAINRDGLKVQSKAGDISVHKVRAVTSPAEVGGPVDLLLVFVKCYHTAEAVAIRRGIEN